MAPVTRGQTSHIVGNSDCKLESTPKPRQTIRASKISTESKARPGNGGLKFKVTKISKKVGKPVGKQGTTTKSADASNQNASMGECQTHVDIETHSFQAIRDGEVLQKAYEHLTAVDARMGSLIRKFPCTTFAADSLNDITEPFMGLSCSIISQQVSGAAASSIRRRFIELFNPDLPASVSSTDELKYFPLPETVAKTDLTTLRTAGLSQRKAEYIQGLAEKFAAGELSKEMLAHASYEEILEKLVAVRGIGQWTVEMFACFGLKRLDIFSVGDLAVQRGMAAFMGRNVAQLQKKTGKWRYLSEAEMLEFSSKFAPYRSLFMWYMWRVVENISVEALKV